MLDETIQSMGPATDFLNKSLESRRSVLSGKCDSCGRQDDKAPPAEGSFSRCLRVTAQRMDQFCANWFESGLWHLSVALTGIVGVFLLCWVLFHTFHFLKRQLITKNNADSGEE